MKMDRPAAKGSGGSNVPESPEPGVEAATAFPRRGGVGRYRLLRLLGQGSFGAVYLAHDPRLDRRVAIKILSAESFAGAVEDLVQEARAAARLSHPAIATVHECGVEGATPFLVTEWVDGETLDERLQRGPLPVEETVHLARALAGALEHAHHSGVVHGDLSPANVLLTGNGQVKLIDFGLAASGGRCGTPGYVAPEVAGGGRVSSAGDVYALGAILHATSTGAAPQPASPTGVRQLERLLPVEAPAALAALIERCLASESERRPNASQVAEGLSSPELAAGAVATEGATAPAFRGLLPFQEGDSGVFFGRDQERDDLVSRLVSPEASFTVLYGPSGCGKTSLLRAAVVPALRHRGVLPIYCPSARCPLTDLNHRCEQSTGITIAGDETTADYLNRVSREMGALVVAIVDQFEEFFLTRRADSQRKPMLEFAAKCHASPGAVTLLVSLRSDFLHLVGSTFDGYVEEPLLASRRFVLTPFPQAAAEQVIRQTAEICGLPLTPDLARRLAADLAVHGRVLPSELQVVGGLLVRRRLYTVREYQQTGGKESLLAAFLEEVVAGSRDPSLARRVLRALISEDGTRAVRTARDVADRLQVDEDQVVTMLCHLADARMVRELQDSEPWRYELVHDYLVRIVEEAYAGAPEPAERARRLLKHSLGQAAIDPRTRIPLLRLVFIRRHLHVQDGAERALMRRSLRSGLATVGAVVVAVALFSALVAAGMSVRETWAPQEYVVGHTAAARQAVVAADGRRLVTAGEDGAVLIWNLENRRLDRRLEAPARLTSVDISPGGGLVAAGGEDGLVHLWEADTGKPMRPVTHSGPVAAVRFSQDATRLVVTGGLGDAGGTAIWSTVAWEPLLYLPAFFHFGNILFPGAGSLVAIDLNQPWFDLSDGSVVVHGLDPAWSGNYRAFSPDERLLTSIDPRGVVRWIDVEGRSELAAVRAHRDHGRAIAFSPDGRLLASGAEDIVLWDAETQAILQRLTGRSVVWDLAFTADSQYLVSAHSAGAVLLWKLDRRELEARLGGHAAPVNALAYSADGGWLASAGDDRSVMLWNAAGELQAVLTGHQTLVTAVAFDPTGEELWSCDQDGEFIRWSLTHLGEMIEQRSVANPDSTCYSIAFAADASHALAGPDLLQRPRQTLIPFSSMLPLGNVYDAAFLPDGRRFLFVTDLGRIAVARYGNDARILEVSNTVGNAPITSLALSSNGELAATGDISGTVQLWSTSPLQRLGLLGEHEARVKALVFSSDDRRVVSAGDDGAILQWNVAGRSLDSQIAAHRSPALALAFHPDGRQLAVGDFDGSVTVYRRQRTLWGRPLPDRGQP